MIARARAFLAWLGHPFRAVRSWFPFTHDGRSTLVYMVLAGAGPALTLCILWAMQIIRNWTGATDAARLDKFASLATLIAAALLIIVTALAAFVSIRAIKIGRDGFEASSFGGDDVVHDGDSVTVSKDGQ